MGHRKVTIRIKRPEGHIETVDVSDKFPGGLWDGKFEQVKRNTLDGGRGECLSYVSEWIMSEQDQAKFDEDQKKAAWFEKHGFNGNDVN